MHEIDIDCVKTTTIDKVDYKEIRDNMSKTIIWTGAGISILSPTCLPSGYALTRFYLDETISPAQSNDILNRWTSIVDIISNVFLVCPTRFSSVMRLEFVIGCIDDVDCEFKRARFISGFSKFSKVLPNENHKIIKSLIEICSPIVVTANFDCCIEKSFTKYLHINKMGINCAKVSNDSMIFHYHGSGYSYKQLGATIRMLKRGFSKDFSKYLRSLFQEGYNIIFLGFSCSDYFDATQFFNSLKSENFYGNLYYVNHDTSNERFIQYKLSAIFQCFSKKTIVTGDTNLFLKKLYKKSTNISIAPNPTIKWNSAFKKVKIDKFVKDCYLIKILNRSGLGINISNDDYKKMKCRIFHMCENYDIKRHLEKMYPDTKEQSIVCDIISIFDCNKSSKIYKSYMEAKQNNSSYKESLRITKKYIIERYKNSPYKVSHAELFALVRIIKDITYDCVTKNADELDIKELKYISARLLSLSPCDFPYISYYTSLSRAYEILNVSSGCYDTYMDRLVYAAEIAIEICATFELYKIVETLIIIYIIRYINTRKYTFLKQSIRTYYKLKKIKYQSKHPDIIKRDNYTSYFFTMFFSPHILLKNKKILLLKLLEEAKKTSF